MSEDYLWDGRGEPEPDVAHLERVLGQLRWSGRHSLSSKPDRKAWLVMSVAASAAIVVGSALWLQHTHRERPLTSWELSITGRQSSRIRAGEVIETGQTQAHMESESIGELDIDPNSRLYLLPRNEDENRLALDRGTIHAFIWAPPAKFVVDTPAAKAVDLGCRYTLSVDKDGEGFLTVQFGWVAFQWKSFESFIPEGAACTTRPGHGPDTPYFLDASPVLKTSLAQFDQRRGSEALRSLLAAARPRDALTLWHLLQRTQGAERAEVFDRFAGLVQLPSGVTRAGILDGDQASFDAAWDALKLGDSSWWRQWKRTW